MTEERVEINGEVIADSIGQLQMRVVELDVALVEARRQVKEYRQHYQSILNAYAVVGQCLQAWRLGISSVKWERQASDEARKFLLGKARLMVRKHKRRRPSTQDERISRLTVSRDHLQAGWKRYFEDPMYPYDSMFTNGITDWQDFVDRVARPMHEQTGTTLPMFRTVSPYYISACMVMMDNRIKLREAQLAVFTQAAKAEKEGLVVEGQVVEAIAAGLPADWVPLSERERRRKANELHDEARSHHLDGTP